MLTTRFFLLTAAGLFSTFLASAQSTTPAGPQATDVLSWVTWWVAGVVLLMALINGATATAAAQRQYSAAAAEQTPAPVAGPVAPTEPTPAHAPAPTPTPAFAAAATPEAIAA
ncbi:hypothetical protein IC235_08430 [Hymenobacter sp. BT664]|uniref:Uncharacterized protein n=1 Tax=Hymenobacter montanus TaxID=2771359 RepID=A0A927GJ93_9BACT|nr:hypothetical protein [Hymenobacter montanus]MBD2767919.1 hypothetical protein [Hymenobacter montanus]